ncbi:MAG TPA: NAD(P)-dependent oxidoreductase, partial [Gammaproteobacteria bacterium]|nr:NAD(P)-dependent oxidoreductase [Gammaproteobacteria bacterium]
MDYLPIFIDIKDRACLVVGGGAVAARKARLLQRAGGRVTVVAPQLSAEMQAYIDSGFAHHRARRFIESDLKNQALIIAATDDEAVNRRVAKLAKVHGLPVNVADNPSVGNFILPSIVDRSPVQIAISTGGSSPVLARRLRASLENYVPAAYGRLAELAKEFRPEVLLRIPDSVQRRRFWEQTLQGPVAEAAFTGRIHAAREMLKAAIDNAPDHAALTGEVYLVGAGPGDPDLLTFRALRLMQQADVVVYDRLVSAPILDLVRRSAERVYAGKYPRGPAVAQEEINALLIRLAKAGK